MNKSEIFFDKMKGKHCAVIGVGVSNTDVIKLFLKKGINVTVCDRKDEKALGDTYTELKALGAEFILGDGYLDTLSSFDFVVRAPGMYFNNPMLKKARENGIPVTSEMELFFDLCPCRIYAVTGSDGKTTTTTIIADLLSRSGKKVYKGGNIGKALLPLIEEISENDAAVVELSSFQLISMRKSPDVAVITNIAPNHLDVHGTMEEYIDSKKNLILHQTAFSRTVLNMDNDITNGLSELVRGKLVKFSRKEKPVCGAFLDEEGWLCYNDYGNVTRIIDKDRIRIPGIHNVENYLAAVKLAIKSHRYRLDMNIKRPDNRKLFQTYLLTEKDVENIILDLTAMDFSDAVHNDHVGFEHETLYIFGKTVLLTERFGSAEKLVSLYIKFNKLDNMFVIVVSFHEQRYPLTYYFKQLGKKGE